MAKFLLLSGFQVIQFLQAGSAKEAGVGFINIRGKWRVVVTA
jgi:hypothetical protein